MTTAQEPTARGLRPPDQSSVTRRAADKAGPAPEHDEHWAERVKIASKILGIPPESDSDDAICVLEVHAVDGGWRFELGGTRVPPCALLIEPVRPGQEYFARAVYLGFRYSAERFEPIIGQLLGYLAKRLKQANIGLLDKYLRPHEAPPMHGDGDGDAAPKPPPERYGPCPGMHQSWNHENQWKWYLAKAELEQIKDSIIQFETPFVYIEHSDFECQFLTPRNFVCYPWKTPNRRFVEPGLEVHDDALAESVGQTPSMGVALYTNYKDIDVITGATGFIVDVMEKVKKHLSPEVVWVDQTCVPEVIGDDTHTLVKQAAETAKFPILYKNQTPVDPYDRNLQMMREAFAAAGAVDKVPGGVALVGFATDLARDELSARIEALGGRVTSAIVPAVAPSMAEPYLRAEVAAFYPNDEWKKFYVDLLGPLDVRRVDPPSPYGIAGTHAFLRDIVTAIGREDRLAELDALRDAFVAAEWAPRVAEARKHRLGLVCELHQFRRLWDAAASWGLPILSTLHEMGFGLDVAVIAPPELVDDAARAEVAAHLPEGTSLTWVAAEPELDAWLEAGTFGPVFSEYFFDSRLIRRRHVPFSGQAFERGWEGAVRSIDRILDRCHLPLVTRYGDLL
ncbi:MAG: hypothetical protein EP329_15430 [Deltaproteobacteria bacterium]|nr:MAG: hypothetical protein EP329_15430 [Deltaproteobacteria bacterium]